MKKVGTRGPRVRVDGSAQASPEARFAESARRATPRRASRPYLKGDLSK